MNLTSIYRSLATALLASAAVISTPVYAGRSCEARPVTTRVIENGLNLALKTSQAFDAEYAKSGAKVIVLARSGQDLSRYGVQYSHLGLAYRTADGSWRVLHKLNHCGTAVASLYRQGLGEFFMDDLWRTEAAWQVPSPQVQDRLYAAVTDPQRSISLNVREYNMVSYVWGRKYQQSNQWAIEMIAMSQDDAIRTREQAQAWLQFKGFEPTTLKLGPLTRLGGRVGSANVAFDDHPSDKRFSDRIETVTVDAVFAWMPRAGLGGLVQTVRL